jgi:homoserine dehydrogenase
MPAKTEAINIGLMGLGTVGGGVAAALSDNADEIRRKTGRTVRLRRVLVRDATKTREPSLPPGVLTTNPEDILADPDIHVLVEVMGGDTPAGDYLERALAGGKHVVTANKEVMAKDGAELMSLARANRVSLLFEASVGGGIPIVGCLMNELAANDVYSIRTIINGTTNYILTRMAHQRTAFAEALAEAQGLGYAEADPTNDVEGIDAAYKLTVLATLAYGRRFRPEDVYRQGISALEPQDFRYAREFGYSIKSLAIADLDDGGVQLRVYPALVPEENMLANVNGVYNAAEVDGDLCGRVLFHGMGAGRGPTTSAVLGDLIETARMVRDDAVPGGSRELSQGLAVRPIDELQTRYYIRLEVADRAGVLAQIAKALGDCDISIASVLQKDAHVETQSAEIVIMTHPARESSVQQALLEISQLSPVRRVGNMIRIEG